VRNADIIPRNGLVSVLGVTRQVSALRNWNFAERRIFFSRLLVSMASEGWMRRIDAMSSPISDYTRAGIVTVALWGSVALYAFGLQHGEFEIVWWFVFFPGAVVTLPLFESVMFLPLTITSSVGLYYAISFSL